MEAGIYTASSFRIFYPYGKKKMLIVCENLFSETQIDALAIIKSSNFMKKYICSDKNTIYCT